MYLFKVFYLLSYSKHCTLLPQAAELFTHIQIQLPGEHTSGARLWPLLTKAFTIFFHFPSLVPIYTPGWRETIRVKCFVQKHKSP